MDTLKRNTQINVNVRSILLSASLLLTIFIMTDLRLIGYFGLLLMLFLARWGVQQL